MQFRLDFAALQGYLYFLFLEKSPLKRMKSILLTVGTFQFDKLIENIISNEGLQILLQRFNSPLTIHVQYGLKSELKIKNFCNIAQTQLYFYEFLESIETFVCQNQIEIVICHGGAGSIIELMGKVSLICIPNPFLTENHQQQFVEELYMMKLLERINLKDLPDALRNCRMIRSSGKHVNVNLNLQRAIFN